MTRPFEHERRFLIGRVRTARFVHAVLPHLQPEIAEASRPLGYVRTTYFDTADWRFLRSAESLVTRRLRLREYAVAADPADTPVFHGMAALELKESSGGRRIKARFLAPPDVLAELLASGLEEPRTWSRRLGEILALRPVLPHLRSGTLRPRVTTWYRRATLAGEDGVRVTVDDGIAFCRPVEIGAPLEPGHVLRVGGGPVLEVKHGATCPAWLAEAMNGLRETPQFSKYRAAAVHLLSLADTVVDRVGSA